MSFSDQLALIRRTNILVGVHGAGLMFIMFAAEEVRTYMHVCGRVRGWVCSWREEGGRKEGSTYVYVNILFRVFVCSEAKGEDQCMLVWRCGWRRYACVIVCASLSEVGGAGIRNSACVCVCSCLSNELHINMKCRIIQRTSIQHNLSDLL